MNRYENIQRQKKIIDLKDARKIECSQKTVLSVLRVMQKIRDSDYDEIKKRDFIHQVNIQTNQGKQIIQKGQKIPYQVKLSENYLKRSLEKKRSTRDFDNIKMILPEATKQFSEELSSVPVSLLIPSGFQNYGPKDNNDISTKESMRQSSVPHNLNKQASYNTFFKEDLNNVNFEIESVSDISSVDENDNDGEQRTLDLDQLSPLQEQDESGSSKTQEDSESPAKTEYVVNPRIQNGARVFRKQTEGQATIQSSLLCNQNNPSGTIYPNNKKVMSEIQIDQLQSQNTFSLDSFSECKKLRIHQAVLQRNI